MVSCSLVLIFLYMPRKRGHVEKSEIVFGKGGKARGKIREVISEGTPVEAEFPEDSLDDLIPSTVNDRGGRSRREERGEYDAPDGWVGLFEK